MAALPPEHEALTPQYTPAELALLRELEKVEGGFALDQMLRGTFWALRQPQNPEAFVQAAQSARELIEKFEMAMHGLTEAGRQDKGRESFKARADAYGKKWAATKAKSRAHTKGEWKGRVDAPLAEFLAETQAFLDGYAQDDIYRKQKEKAVVLRLDPMFSALSEKDQKRITREWVELRQFFLSVAHHGNRKVTREQMEAELARLVRYLHRRLAPVDAENKAAIRAHIEKWEKSGVTDAAIAELPGLLHSGADAAFFFANLASPDWLPVLRRAGEFSTPPPPFARDGTDVHPWWPQSRFLLKVSAAAPAEVAIALAAIPETKNLNVNEDIFRAACLLPPKHVGGVVRRVRSWIKSANLRWHSRALANLVRNLALGGNVGPALGVMEDILAFTLGELPPEDRPKKGSLFDWTPEPKARFDAFEYGELLRAVLPPLAPANGKQTLAILCRLLDGYIRARGRKGPRSGYDGSAYWRPSVADGSQNPFFDAATELISGLRQLGDDQLRDGRLSLPDVLAMTRQYRWDLFRRLELYWMRTALDQVSPVALQAALVKRAALHSTDIQLEYGLLLQAGFSRLKSADRRKILGWINAGPALASLIRGKRTLKAVKAAIEWAIRWRMSKLYWIQDGLPKAWRAKYAQWKAKGWEPSHPGYAAWHGGVETVGAQSPLDVAAFRAWSVPQQVDYLRTWNPTSTDWNAPSRSGLAGVLQVAVAEKPADYAAAAETFIGLAPEYVAAFFSALWDKWKEGAPVPLASVYSLADWMLQQPDGEVDLVDDFTRQTIRGRRWAAARLALVRLLHALLRVEPHPLPAADRPRIWAIVAALAEDPDPSVHAKAEDGDDGDRMGPFTLSLNSIRGQAFHAVFEFIAWCNRISPKGEPRGLPPETKPLLEKHLDPAHEGTLTVRSVYGANINRLMYWDADWLAANRRRIFPGGDQPRLNAIGWDTFISHARPYLDVLRLLEEQFREAIREMRLPQSERPRDDPRALLGNYLVALYWAGHIGIDAKDDLLVEFFAHAPDDVRAGVLTAVGRGLKAAAVPLDLAVIDRLRRLWEWRLQVARGVIEDHGTEIAAFAWWFDSGRLDRAWSAAQMVEVLALAQRPEQQFLWMKPFAEMAETETALAVRAAELTYEVARAAGATFWNDEEAIRILRAGLKSTDAETVHRAKRVQDALLREGRSEFLDLR